MVSFDGFDQQKDGIESAVRAWHTEWLLNRAFQHIHKVNITTTHYFCFNNPDQKKNYCRVQIFDWKVLRNVHPKLPAISYSPANLQRLLPCVSHIKFDSELENPTTAGNPTRGSGALKQLPLRALHKDSFSPRGRSVPSTPSHHQLTSPIMLIELYS